MPLVLSTASRLQIDGAISYSLRRPAQKSGCGAHPGKMDKMAICSSAGKGAKVRRTQSAFGADEARDLILGHIV